MEARDAAWGEAAISLGIQLEVDKSIMDQCRFGEKIDLKVEEGRVILARDRKPREGWEEALVLARKSIVNDELLLDGIPEHEFDGGEWTW